MVVAVDFDGTLCESKWPEIGEEKPKIVRMIKEMKEAGDKIILWTCRSGELLEAAVDWCRERGIEFDAVNENLPELIEKFGADSRKISAQLYIDDKSMTETNALSRHEMLMAEIYAKENRCKYCLFEKTSICLNEMCYQAGHEAREEFRKGRK